MRKLYGWIAVSVLSLGICLTGCAQYHAALTEKPPAQMQPRPVQTEETPAQTDGNASASALPSVSNSEEPVAAGTETPDVDVDLTKLNANMRYAELYNMGLFPQDYEGKTVKVSGLFTHFPKETEEAGAPPEEVYVCIISDAMACCAIDVTFIPEPDALFWTDYPEVGSEITVTGRCTIFPDETGWFTVIQLDNASVVPA